MKKIITLMLAAVLVFALTACNGGGSDSGDGSGSNVTLAATDVQEKSMTLQANKADEGDFLMTGALVVGEYEEIEVVSSLDSGSVQLEFIAAEGEGDIDSVPEGEGEAEFSATATGTEAESFEMPEGSYMVRATVAEKGTAGTVQINVLEVDED